MANDLPLAVLASTVCAYWSTILVLVVAKRWRHGASAGIVPRQPFERRLWLLVLPVVLAWITLPLIALATDRAPFAVPAWVREAPAAYGLRWCAAAVGVTCYLSSVYCWLVMGRSWSMAVVPGQSCELVTGGLYRWVRHPIYSLSVALMVASVFVVCTLPMAVIGIAHVVAMNLKAGNEERHLEKSLGLLYVDYSRRVGRFWPRWTVGRRSA